MSPTRLVSAFLSCAVVLLCTAPAWSQRNTRAPHIGYLYPGGGQQGSVVQITVGGQFLRNARDVYVSGDGVQASVIKYLRPLRNIQREQRELLQKRFREVRDRRLAELSGKAVVEPVVPKKKPAERRDGRAGKRGGKKRNPGKKATDPKTPDKTPKPEVKMPDHPLLHDLDSRSLRELVHIRSVLMAPRRRRQINRQIAESLIVEIRIAANAAPGMRQLRIGTRSGLTNPMTFQVGVFRETRELEPNDRKAQPDVAGLPKAKPIELPVVLNGQILPGDVDRFRFRARKGQRLVIEAHARSLIPYLADAVPGWFQATLALHDASGKEVAFVDDFRFNPDPVMLYEIPESGQYELEIRDSIYRGREDFVYRIVVGEQPFITQVFPLGGQAGVDTVAKIDGWNLPWDRIPLDTQPGAAGIRKTMRKAGGRVSNEISYAVDGLPECLEASSNDGIATAQPVDMPVIVNGRIEKAGDVDVYEIRGNSGDQVVVEVVGRQLGSPLDSLLRVTNASGKVLAWNDDYVVKEQHLHKNMAGLATHHADSYLRLKLPLIGRYYVHVADAQNAGSPAHAYRLRISAPQADFALRISPSSHHVRAGTSLPVTVHALRRDGFRGGIRVVLKDAPNGFSLSGGHIPAGQDSVRMMLRVPNRKKNLVTELRFEGTARVGKNTITRAVVPAEDVMQAFLFRHLVPTEDFMVMVAGSRWPAAGARLVGKPPVRIRSGGSKLVRVRIGGKRRAIPGLDLELVDPPEGLSLHDVTPGPGTVAFTLKVKRGTLKKGYRNNLIIQAFREDAPKPKEGKPAPKPVRRAIGYLPAIPIAIVR